MEPMTPEEFARQMRWIASGREDDQRSDTELAHIAADALFVKALKSLGYGEGCEVFEKMKKWYS